MRHNTLFILIFIIAIVGCQNIQTYDDCTQAGGQIDQQNSSICSIHDKNFIQEQKQEIANPASVFCKEQGGTLTIMKSSAGEYGLCKLPNGIYCEEWALMRGECEGRTYCSPESRNEEVCSSLYNPVCTDSNREKSNACEACKLQDVTYYTQGSCNNSIRKENLSIE